MKYDKPLGDVLKQIRNDNKLSQKEFIRMLGVNQSTYSNYENNRYNIPESFLERVGKIFNIDIDEYIFEFFKDYENQEQYLVGYENPVEQLMFFDELNKIRHYIDNKENKWERRTIANLFGQFLDWLDAYIKYCQSEPSDLEEPTVEDKLNETYYELLEAISIYEGKKIAEIRHGMPDFDKREKINKNASVQRRKDKEE